MRHPRFEVVDGWRGVNGNGEHGYAESATNGLRTARAPATVMRPMIEPMTSREPECIDSEAFPTAVRASLKRFDPVGLGGVKTIAMADRIDTKFLLTPDQLLASLDSLRDAYRVLDIDSVRLHRYQTLYFDTGEFDLYLRHHNGGRNSYKVRSRQYLDSGCTFLEIKRKISSNRSVKTRTETPAPLTELTPDADRFIAAHSRIAPRRLEPVLWNRFDRVTLLSKTGPERLTLDIRLRYHNAVSRAALPEIAVAELKQEEIDRSSIVFRHMSSLGVRPTGFSKYCIGVPTLYPHVRHNRIKPKLRLIRRVAKEGSDAS